MTRRRRLGRLAAGVMAGVFASALVIHAQAKGEHAFRGKVESVDQATKTISVTNENIEGWMPPMTMSYKVDDAVLAKMMKGDEVTATVHDGDFQHLYSVKVEAATARRPRNSRRSRTHARRRAKKRSFSTSPASVPSRERLSAGSPRPGVLVPEGGALHPRQTRHLPDDHTKLVSITVGLYFTCKDDPSVKALNPGKCKDRSDRVKLYERRPHGDHNPRHGGAFFMSADQWHHLEGTFVHPDIFRVYFYDDMSRPLVPKGFIASVAPADGNGTQTGTAEPLAHAKGAPSNSLQVAVKKTAWPENLKFHLQFDPTDPDELFDFTFAGYSKEP